MTQYVIQERASLTRARSSISQLISQFGGLSAREKGLRESQGTSGPPATVWHCWSTCKTESIAWWSQQAAFRESLGLSALGFRDKHTRKHDSRFKTMQPCAKNLRWAEVSSTYDWAEEPGLETGSHSTPVSPGSSGPGFCLLGIPSLCPLCSSQTFRSRACPGRWSC